MDATVQDARVEDQGTDGLAEGVAVLPPPQTGALRPEAAEPPRAKRADLTPSLLMSGEDVEAVEVRGEVSRCVLDPVGGGVRGWSTGVGWSRWSRRAVAGAW